MGNLPNYGSMAEKGELPTSNPTPPTTDLSIWMSTLPNTLPISALSIPGTHDSASFKSTWPYISTQRLTTTEQLDFGIRYFDLRCGLIKDELQMVHGRAVLGLSLSSMLTDIYTWLSHHPTECLIIQLKQDRATDSSTLDFSFVVALLLSQAPNFWRLTPTTPTLGDLRGRIQLLRRFTGQRTWGMGIDVSRWQDNPMAPFTIHTRTGVHLTIQDHYAPTTPESLPALVQRKGGDIVSLLVRASHAKEENHWFINFCSAYEINVYHQIAPKEIALGGYAGFRWVDGINVRLVEWLGRNRGQGSRWGVVLLDFPEMTKGELVKTIVESNFGLKGVRKERLGMAWRSWGIVFVVLLVLGMVWGVLVALRTGVYGSLVLVN